MTGMSQRSTIETFARIALLRSGPQDLPFSTGLMGAVIAITAAINYPVIARYTPESEPLLQILLLLLYNLGFLGAALWIRGHSARFVQTATAVFGTDVIVSTIALPVLLVIGSPNESNALAAISFLVLIIWNIAIVNHILHQALMLNRVITLGITLVYIFGASAFVRAVIGA